MPTSIFHSPFTTALSGSAKETEDRIRNIFQYKKKRPPLLLFILACALALTCGCPGPDLRRAGVLPARFGRGFRPANRVGHLYGHSVLRHFGELHRNSHADSAQ